jgi:hypothetical protein
VDWIKSVYPEARFLSAEQPAGCIVSLQTAARYCLPVGQRSGYALPSWIYAHDVFVDAAPGTAVMLSDWDNLSYNRIATFVGTVENGGLKQVKAVNGQVLDFSRPHSMRVVRDTTPLGCIVSLTSGAKYCLPAGQRSGRALPSWIYANEVQVEAAAGIAVMLSDTDDLAFNRVATFTGLTQNWELKKAKAWNGEDLDFRDRSRCASFSNDVGALSAAAWARSPCRVMPAASPVPRTRRGRRRDVRRRRRRIRRVAA